MFNKKIDILWNGVSVFFIKILIRFYLILRIFFSKYFLSTICELDTFLMTTRIVEVFLLKLLIMLNF